MVESFQDHRILSSSLPPFDTIVSFSGIKFTVPFGNLNDEENISQDT